MLTYKRAHEVFMYEPETGFVYRRLKNGLSKEPVGCPNNRGYLQVWVDKKCYKLHRIIWLMVHGKWPKEEIDHKDRDNKNNKLVNLRESSRSENCGNTFYKRNTSGFKGVHFAESKNKKGGVFIAQATKNGKKKYLGSHPTAEKAARAYDKFAVESFGIEFAMLNFPEEWK